MYIIGVDLDKLYADPFSCEGTLEGDYLTYHHWRSFDNTKEGAIARLKALIEYRKIWGYTSSACPSPDLDWNKEDNRYANRVDWRGSISNSIYSLYMLLPYKNPKEPMIEKWWKEVQEERRNLK